MTAKFTVYMADDGKTKSTSFTVDPSEFSDESDFQQTVISSAKSIGKILKYPVIKASYAETTVVEIA